jgi:hypothetical protein
MRDQHRRYSHIAVNRINRYESTYGNDLDIRLWRRCVCKTYTPSHEHETQAPYSKQVTIKLNDGHPTTRRHVYHADQDDIIAGDTVEPDAPTRVTLMYFRNSFSHEFVNGATDVPYEFFKGDWVAVRSLIARLKLALPLVIARPLGMRDEHHEERAVGTQLTFIRIWTEVLPPTFTCCTESTSLLKFPRTTSDSGIPIDPSSCRRKIGSWRTASVTYLRMSRGVCGSQSPCGTMVPLNKSAL